jgi:hypothetical protein
MPPIMIDPSHPLRLIPRWNHVPPSDSYPIGQGCALLTPRIAGTIAGKREGLYLDEIREWLQSIDRPFAFLVALPFLVVAAAGLGEIIRKQTRRNRHQ